jgi:NADP-dependent 3-hydroxy acid dehydrogenase YdfG
MSANIKNSLSHNHNNIEGIFMKKPTVLITGALAGIGRATALAFARDGAQIVISGRREELAKHW